MSMLTPLIALELRQTVAEAPAGVAPFLKRRLATPAGPLPAALARAGDWTWRGLAVALAAGRPRNLAAAVGDADAAWVEELLRRFSDQIGDRFRGATEEARREALAEWREARRQGRFAEEYWGDEELTRQAAALPRYDDPAEMAAAAGRAEALVADALSVGHPQLARLLREQAGAPPLLTAAFAYFFRREVESNEELSGELMCDGLRQMSAPLAVGLAGLAQALGRLGSRFDALIDLPPGGGSAGRAAAPPPPLARRPASLVAPAPAARRPARGRSSAIRRTGLQPESPEPRRPASLSSPPSAQPRPGPTFVNSLGMQFVWVPPGEFVMGSPPDEDHREADETPHPARLSRGLFLGAHPVTRGQFTEFVRATKHLTDAERKGGAHRGPSGEWKLDPGCNWKRPDFPQEDDHPVVCVSWNDARAFCAWLADRDQQRDGVYRLPTEAEWEYACRAGTSTPYWHGDTVGTGQANYNGQAGGDGDVGLFREGTTPVWVFPPNPWGLFDMHGNVWEWCADWYGPYAEGGAGDPQGPPDGRNRVLRGGSWRNQSRFLRSAARNQLGPSGRDRDAGFRVCLVV